MSNVSGRIGSADPATRPPAQAPAGLGDTASVRCAEEDDFNRLMDATQTLIQLTPGDVLTQEMIDDLHLVDLDHRESFERAADAFHKGYESGLARGAGADTAKLIEERDEARSRASIVNALSSAAERFAFIRGAQVCREMMARFVGHIDNGVIAQSIRLNWRPSWGDDPGAPDEQKYLDAAPCEISAKASGTEARQRQDREDGPDPKGDGPTGAAGDAPRTQP